MFLLFNANLDGRVKYPTTSWCLGTKDPNGGGAKTEKARVETPNEGK